MRTWDIRHRPLFTASVNGNPRSNETWSAILRVEYAPRLVQPQKLYSWLKFGGRAIGIGEWRPEKGGNWGKFEVVKCEAEVIDFTEKEKADAA